MAFGTSIILLERPIKTLEDVQSAAESIKGANSTFVRVMVLGWGELDV